MLPEIAPETITYFKRLEAFRAVPYVDRGGALAIGYGHSNKAGTLPVVVPGMVISEEEATRILTEVDIPYFWSKIKDGIKTPLTPYQRGAVILLSYNIGPTAFAKSSVLRYLNEGNYVKAATSFLMWNKSEGKVLDGLTLRRAEEVVLFRHGWWEHK
jgi:lysozyme